MYKLFFAEEIEINLEDLAREVKKLSLRSTLERERILKEAEEKIPKDIAQKAIKLTEDLCYHRGFCREAGISYIDPDYRLIKTTIASYLLSNKH